MRATPSGTRATRIDLSRDLILLAYFLTSRRAKAVLTQPFDAEVKQREIAKDLDCYQPLTWEF